MNSRNLNSFDFETIELASDGSIVGTVKCTAHYLPVTFSNESIEMARIPAGCFEMGSLEDEPGGRNNELPRHQVNIRQFFLGKTTITQKQWFEVMNTLPGIDEEFRDPDFPAVNVWWEQAQDFCRRLSTRTGLAFRLPTEAEWEYACRGGTTSPFHFGETITNEVVNFDSSRPFSETAAIAGDNCLVVAGTKGPPNQFGLLDMHGNVWEWCSDVWHDDYNGAPSDGSDWSEGSDSGYRVQRGGSWVDPGVVCRSAFRVGDIAHNSDHIVGIRVCLSDF
jgi:formylglycine-generating enzyme required for sulfatase activity